MRTGVDKPNDTSGTIAPGEVLLAVEHVVLSFGGVKATGNGHREGGIGAIDFYSEWKAVYVDYSDKLQRAQIDRPE